MARIILALHFRGQSCVDRDYWLGSNLGSGGYMIKDIIRGICFLKHFWKLDVLPHWKMFTRDSWIGQYQLLGAWGQEESMWSVAVALATKRRKLHSPDHLLWDCPLVVRVLKASSLGIQVPLHPCFFLDQWMRSYSKTVVDPGIVHMGSE